MASRIVLHMDKTASSSEKILGRILGSSLLTKDNIIDLFSSPKDMEEPNDGQLKIGFDFN